MPLVVVNSTHLIHAVKGPSYIKDNVKHVYYWMLALVKYALIMSGLQMDRIEQHVKAVKLNMVCNA